MRKIHILLSMWLTAAVAMSLTSCEKILDFEGEQKPGIAVYALATTDAPFSMMVSRSFTINDSPSHVFTSVDKYNKELDSLYQTQIAIKDAQAEITVNGTEKYTLTYNDKEPFDYTCDYRPQVGDKIEVNVKAPGYDDVSATTVMNEPRKIEVVGTEVVYSDNGDDGTKPLDNPYEYYGVDSVMRITLRIHDPGSTHDFYRLRVRGLAERYQYTGIYKDTYYTISDAFTSEDVIFVDNMLTKPFGDWKAGISNVFDDHLFNGQDYTFTVESRKRYGEKPQVILELQTITPDMYYFLKSYQQFRISTDDVYTNPIGLYSNVGGGWGILGSLTYDRHIIYY